MFHCGLEVGEMISNRRLMDIFHCACEGGIRYASATNTIVLVVNNTKEGRPNTWKDGILEFSGRPFKEAQVFAGANARLEQFLKSGGDIFLFIVNRPGTYEYAGQVQSAGSVRVAGEDDISWPIFPLKVITHQ